MFSEKRTILYVTGKLLRLVTVVLGKNPTIEDSHDFPLEHTSVKAVVDEIKKRVKSQKIRVLVGDDYSYVLEVTLPYTKDQIKKETLQEKIQEIIPENLNETTWEYYVLDSQTSQVRIQVFVLTKRFIDAFSLPLQSSGITIEHFEPVSFSLVRLTLSESAPHIIIHNAESCEMVLAHQGIAWATEIVGSTPISEKVSEFLSFIHNNLKIEVKKIIVSDPKPIGQLGVEDPSTVIQQKILDPVMGLALKGEKDISNTAVIPIATVQKASPEKPSIPTTTVSNDLEAEDIFATPLSVQPIKPRPIKKIIIISVCIAALGVLGGIFLWTRRSSEEVKPEPLNTSNSSTPPAPSAEPTKNEETIDLSKLSVHVLNGSGKVGEASKVKSLIEGKGFSSIDTGNAKSYDYEKTVIQKKKTIPDTIYISIEEALKEYEVQHGEPLTEDSEYDVVIIIGKSLKEDNS